VNDRIIQFLLQQRNHGAFSGAAFAYGNSSDVLGQGTVGTLSWDGKPVDMQSLWDLASVTKPIVAIALMRLFERGEMCLDDTISFFLPDYKGTDKENITLHQLLSHTSGIPGQQPIYQQATTPEQMLSIVKNLPLRSAPGTEVEYSSQGFMIIGQIIEAISETSLDKVLEETVLQPLAMRQTLFNPPEHLHHCIAATENCTWRGKMIQGEVHDENAVVLGGIAGHAGLFSNVEDLVRLCQMMLQLGSIGQESFLRPATVRCMTRNHTPDKKLARALGWQAKDTHNSPAGDLFSPTSYGHTGFTGTSIWMDPESDHFAILLANRVHPNRMNGAINRVRAIFNNLTCMK
jgi:CubicO group peptidase (beta-lactamase class C family)